MSNDDSSVETVSPVLDKTVSPVSESGQTVLNKTDSAISESAQTVLEESGVSVLPVTDGVDSKTTQPVKRKGGRPKKADIQSKLKPGKKGRPKGDYTLARELCARMLVANSDRMMQTLVNMALTDGHPQQIAALKMCLDRALPISYFEDKKADGGGGQGITINISGLTTSANISTSDDVVDVEDSNGT